MFVFLNFENLSHLQLFLIEFLKKFLYLFYFREFGIEGVKIIFELISFAHKTSDTSHGLRTDNTFFMVGMSTLEMNGFLSVIDGISACLTIPISSETIEFLIVIIL